MSGGRSSAPVIDLIARAAACAGQTGQAIFFQQIDQVPGGGRLGYIRYRLVLRGADAVLEALFATVEQAIEHPDLLGRQGDVTVLLPEPGLDQLSARVAKPASGVGNSQWCQVNKRLRVNGWANCSVASIISSARPSLRRLT